MDREELIKKINNKCFTFIWDGQQNIQILNNSNVADFIIEDRKRICEPLVNLKLDNGGSSYELICQGIEKTLKRAGLEQ